MYIDGAGPSCETAEKARLSALRSLNLLDTPQSEAFDRVTRMAAQLFRLPIAAVSLTDSDRQWFKSRVGVEHQSIPRHKAPCSEVAGTSDVLVIEDFEADPFYCDSLLGVNGTRFYAGAPLITREGHSLGALCVLGTEPRKVEPHELEALKDLAAMVMDQIELQHAFGRIDAVSGLPNRIQFLEDLNDLAAEAPNDQRIAAVVCLGTSSQLERYGRALGAAHLDAVIKEGAQRLKELKGPGAQVYHVGASQFAFLAPRGYSVDQYLGRLQALLQQGQLTGNGRLLSTIATGLAPFTTKVDGPRDVMQRMLSALHEARLAGHSCSVFSQTADDGYNIKFRMLQDFETALQSTDQLRIVLQPRIDLNTRLMCGAEVLLRWNHPELGQLSPADFIPVLETSPLVHKLTDWVLATALDELSGHNGTITLSVNISATDLKQSNFADNLLHALQERELPPSCLELEVTETVMMGHCDTASRNLRSLVDAGVGVAIDDFGTGYSSLSYLQRLPITTLKIDRSFVSEVSHSRKDHALVDTLVNLGRMLGYRVVAEGIEDWKTADLLEAMGCHEGQGYVFSKPLELADFRVSVESAAQEHSDFALAI